MIIYATSTEFNLGCSMGPANVSLLVSMPILLSSGEHTVRVYFTTLDGLFHLNAFYELDFLFE
jgi:hypothetical protein